MSVIVPTFNEGPNVERLVSELRTALWHLEYEVLFVDDSIDNTPRIIERIANDSSGVVRLLHRPIPTGGLSGAVIEGLRSATFDTCVVMDGDLQHPPGTIPKMVQRYWTGEVDVVVASRYTGSGSANGLAGVVRAAVSRLSTALTRAMFPIRLRHCTDPMTGFFLVNRRAIELSALQPRGFKILLEILARQTLRVAEVPFHFGKRHAGDSKATFHEGVRFLRQLAALRFGKASGFAIIGAIGAVANVGIVAGLSASGLDYIWAAIIAAEATIVSNFLLIERFVFAEMRAQAEAWPARFLKSFLFNNAEAVVRIPIMALLVENWHISGAVATALTLAVAFAVRFAYHALVVYAPRKSELDRSADDVDAIALHPNEL